MIGYYVHHQGRGHAHRAQVLADVLGEEVVGLSSLPRPAGWRGPWQVLPRDDEGTIDEDVTAGDQLHWVPLGHDGLRRRGAAVSAWIESARPRAVVADVSVEIALLARLHGVPVVSIVVPGQRTDPAHLLGYRVSTLLVGMWPPDVTGMTPGLPAEVAERIVAVGAASRYAPAGPDRRRRSLEDRRHAVVLQGRGGEALTRRTGRELEQGTDGWRWTVLGGASAWVEDPREVLASADVVVTHAGQGALADVAALRRPAVVVPSPRPHREQETTADALAAGDWPAVVLGRFPEEDAGAVLDRAVLLDGQRWSRWCDGAAAVRFARALTASLLPAPQGAA